MNKKILSFILICAVLMSSFMTPAMANEEIVKAMTVGYFINRNFNNDATGGLSSETNTNGNIVQVVEYPSATNKSYYFKSTNAASAFTNGSCYTLDTVIYSFKIQYINSQGSSLQLQAYESKTRSAVNLVTIQNGNLLSYDGKLIAIIGEKNHFTQVSAIVDIDAGLIDVYVDGQKRASQIPSKVSSFPDIGEIRLNFGGGEGYIDDFLVYTAEMPIEVADAKGIVCTQSTTLSISNSQIAKDNELAEFAGDALFVYNNKSKYYYKGEAFEYKESVYSGDAQKGLVSAAFAKDVFGIEATGETIDAKEFAEKAGLKLTLDKNGMAVFADTENFFTYTNDIPMYNAVARKLVFENIPAKEMMDIFYTRYENNEHPRLMANAERWNEIYALSKTDENMKFKVENVISVADTYIGKDAIVPTPSASEGNYLGTARGVLSRVEILGPAYQFTKDPKYAEQLWKDIEVVCTYETGLDNSHMLTTGEYMAGLGLAYDWLYDWLSEDKKQLIRTTMIEKGFKAAIEDYEDIIPRHRSYKWIQGYDLDNWLTVVNTGMLLSAFAIYEEEPEICETIINYAMDHIQRPMLGFAPDGAWEEGCTYWYYNNTYLTRFINSLDSMFGTIFGYMDSPGVSVTVDYIIALQGDNGAANFGDANQSGMLFDVMLLFSDMLNKPEIQNYYLGKGGKVNLFNYRPDFNTGEEISPALDYYSRGTQELLMHSGYGDNSIFVAFHSGNVSGGHSQYDTGTFTIDAYGDNFAMDLGQTSYGARPVNYAYRRRAEAHNLFVINPSFHFGQQKNTTAIIDRWESNEGCVYGISDITSPYSNHAEKAVRGIRLTGGREFVVVQDEIKLKEPGSLYWFVNSECPITVSEDGKSALFEGKYKNMRATLLTDVDGTFSVMPCTYLPTSGVASNDTDDSNINRLALYVDNVSETTIAVAFTFEWPGIEEEVSYEVVPLDQWKLDETESYQKPTLTDIKVDGKTIKRFHPDNKMYTIYYDIAEGTPLIDAKGEGDIEITYPETETGSAYITQTGSNGVKSIYAIRLIGRNLKVLENGSKEIVVESLEASDVPQKENAPENLLDGDVNTRYSAENTPYVTLNLGDVKEITDVAVACMWGNERVLPFKVSVSSDGENFAEVLSAQTSGTTIDPEYYSIDPVNAQYIRFNFLSAGWNSVSEVEIYGK